MENCIRDCADIDQLTQCIKNLERIQSDLEKKARVLNMAGNGVRLKILYLLSTEKAMCPCDLSDVLGMTVPAVSQHLRKLKDADVVASVKKGQTIFYSIHPTGADIILPILESLKTKEYEY